VSSTRATIDLYGLLRDSALAFVDANGDSLTSLSVPFYCGTAPAEPSWAQPYVVCRLFSRLTSGESHGQRETASLELQVFGRPRGTQAPAVEQVGDILDGWLLQYRSAVAGLVFSKGRSRDTLPTFADPADREVYQIRIVASLVVWPQLLTQYTP
jgi:hypothetical protein